MKKRFKLVSFAIILMFFSVPVYANTAYGVDILLLMDVSGSTGRIDPDRAALTAAIDLIEMLPSGISRVGVIGFSGRIQHYFPFSALDSDVRAQMVEEISRFQYVGFTDIGLALLTAASIFENVDELNNPMVLLVSDGNIGLSPAQAPRTNADSYSDIETALDIFEVNNIPVHTVGLSDGVDADVLQMIAERSRATAQFTNDATVLSAIFTALLENHIGDGFLHLEDDEPMESEDTTETLPLEAPSEEIIEAPTEIEAEAEPFQETEEPTQEAFYEESHDAYELYAYEANDDAERQPLIGWRRNLLFGLAIFFAITASISVIRLVKAVSD